MYLLGYDIGTSSIKASIIEVETIKCIISDFYPKKEQKIIVRKENWAEQEPEMWWKYLKFTTKAILKHLSQKQIAEIKVIGISYQMHGLVCIDKNKKVLRPSIIWCDSRATEYGEKAFKSLGKKYCLTHLLNSPGNFTASKLAWLKYNEPKIYDKIDKIILPGDYIAMKLSGEITTTVSALSEGIFWDFKENRISEKLMNYFGFSYSFFPKIQEVFSLHGIVKDNVAEELGLPKGVEIRYKAGDQFSNALSLNVFEPGEVAATAGTSGVIYGINDSIKCDPFSRINYFAHINHSKENTRLGTLLCINGTGILYSWLRNIILGAKLSYNEMDELSKQAPIGSKSLTILPFGNGCERIMNNKDFKCSILGLNFNIHKKEHIIRAAQEGIVFSMFYGINIMKEMGMHLYKINASYSKDRKSVV